MRRARYSWRRLGDAVVIVDLCRPGCASVTNDAERVVEDLRDVVPDLRRRRVIYRDSMGVWDGLLIASASGAFVGFLPLQARTAWGAYCKHRALLPSPSEGHTHHASP